MREERKTVKGAEGGREGEAEMEGGRAVPAEPSMFLAEQDTLGENHSWYQ